MLMTKFYFKDEFTAYEKLLLDNGAIRKHYSSGVCLLNAFSLPRRTSYYIVKGDVRFSGINDNGDEIVFFYLGRGTIFPFGYFEDNFSLELFLRLTVGKPCEILEFPTEKLVSLMSQFSELTIAMMNYYSQCMYSALSRLLIDSHPHAAQRVYSFLYLYMHNKPENDYTITMSQERISTIADVSRPQLCRVLKDLREKGIISTARKKLTIEDPDKLYVLCNEMVQYSKDNKKN